jgi:hypothetical protein
MPRDKHHGNHTNIVIHDTALVLHYEIVIQRIPRLRKSEVEMAEESPLFQTPQ